MQEQTTAAHKQAIDAQGIHNHESDFATHNALAYHECLAGLQVLRQVILCHTRLTKRTA